MMVLVDTAVLSLALRRHRRVLSAADADVVREVEELIAAGRVLLPGVVRQEILTGMRDAKAFVRLRAHLRDFDDVRAETSDYEMAAEFTNRCLARGVAGAAADFLICAIADRRRASIFTTDGDFARYAKVVPVRLHEPRPSRRE